VADDVEPRAAVDQNVVQLDVGNDRGGDERQYAGPCHVLGAVECPEGDGCAPPPLVWGCLRDPWGRRQDLAAQGLHVPAGGELPAFAVHYVQLLAAVIIDTGVGASSEDVLEDLLGGLIPEVPLSHDHIAVVDPLLARSATGWGAILGRLLSPLANALRELDDLAALRGAVATVGVHRACAVVASLWPWALVALVPAPSRSCDDRSSSLRPLVVVVLLLLFAVLGDGTRATRLGDSGLWCRVPCTALGSSGTLVSQSEERGDSFHAVRGPRLQHLFITHPLAESDDDGSIRDTGYSPSYLGEVGDEGPESFLGFLPHSMEVSLHAMPLISVGEVRCEPRTELFPGVDRPWGEVHEPVPDWPRQGYMEICRHHNSVSTCCRNSGDVYLQEFRRV
jgi:hypothetical protein